VTLYQLTWRSDGELFYQILRIRKLLVVEVHVPLRRRDFRVLEQPPGELDPPSSVSII
jgi:hypothetical protein